MPLATVILAGGEGRRMGGGKPLRMLDGVPLIDHAVEIARRQSALVAVAVRAPDQIGDRGVVLVADDPAIPGPLGGLAAALRFAARCGEELVMTLPCDAPRLPADLGRRLREGLGLGDQVAMAVSCGRLHPTCAVWRVAALPALESYYAKGRASLHGLATEVGLARIDWGEAEPDPFANLNTLEELAAEQGRGP